MRCLVACILPALFASAGCFGSPRDQRSQPSDAIQPWAGAYEYVDSAGPTAGGTEVVVTYRLEIPQSTPRQATLRIVGFQADETLRCDVSGTRTEIAVGFRGYADGRLTNAFGVSVYQPNAVLFTLQTAAGTAGVVTEWRTLKPAAARAPSGRYFERVRAAPK
jgi:Family of unknown function (DUF5991)